jgi:hypothetical protein
MLRILLLRLVYSIYADATEDLPELVAKPVDDFPDWVFFHVKKTDCSVLDEDSIIGIFERVEGKDQSLEMTEPEVADKLR